MIQQSEAPTPLKSAKPVVQLEDATVRFCGDSGDGMQLAGTQLTNTSALAGNDVATFPDFPAEIRAPRGTKAGVSGFQIHFASREIFTPGDEVHALVAMNPAALVTNLGDLVKGGILIVNKDSFDEKDLKMAGYETSPLDDDSLDGCPLFLGSYPITPASDILHELTRYKSFGVRAFQAEDEIAAVTAAIGTSFG